MKQIRFIVTFIALLLCSAITTKAQSSWNFTSVSSSDITNLSADNQNWTHEADEKNDRYKSVKAYNAEPLMANGVELDFTKGLLFTATTADAIRVDVKGGRMALNKTTTITVNNLKAGSTITVTCKSSSKTEARGLNVTNITPVSGSFNSTSLDDQTNVGTVTADGPVTLQNTGGLYVYSIKVSEEGEKPEAGYNSVSRNTAKNQMLLTLNTKDINYYNTDEVSLDIDNAAGKLTVTPVLGSWSDTYDKAVTNISFSKTETNDDGNGEIINKGVEITEAKGWLESAYVKWNLYDGATSYNVYVKGGQYADYTKIDWQLVRNYGTYGRADMVGLTSGTYSMRVVPVKDKSELTDAASEAISMEVKNYDRSGFAHFNNTSVGAYNNDGSLKDNAVVLYITNNNFNTIKCDMTVGKNTETRTGLGDILNAFEKGTETRPFAIRFIGQISDADKAQLLGEAGSLQLKGKGSSSVMNLTFEGVGNDATWYGWGLTLTKCSGVEVRNIATMLFADDGIQLKDGSHVWVHNNDIFYGNTGGDNDQAKGDGSLDTKDSGSYNTFSYNHFWDSGKCSLCGMKDENTDDYETYHHNWFDHSDSRHPRVRTKTVHVYNNYYDGVSKYGVGATMGSSVFVENNYFRSSKNPMLISKQGRDAQGDGTFSGEDGGMIKSFGNLYVEKGTKGSYTPITHKDNATSFDCYEAETRDEEVPSSYKALVGGTAYNNFDTNSSLMYEYIPDATANVPGTVTGFYGAGRMSHGDFQWSFNNATDDADYDVIAELKNALKSYKTQLKGFFDGEDSDGNGGGGGDDGDNGDGGDTTTPIEGTVLCVFTGGAPSSDMFTVTGKYSNSKGSATIDGTVYTECLKMESSTEVKFSVSSKMEMTLYFADTETASVKINGEKKSGTSSTFTATLEAGAYTLTKNKSVNLFGIKLVPVTE